MEEAGSELLQIVRQLKERLTDRLSSVVEDPLFKAMATFLDTPSYLFHEFGDIASEFDVIVNWFKILLEANGCAVARVKEELETVVDHVKQFMPRNAASKVWPYLFSCQNELCITNVLHVAEISLSIPLSNAETERVFSFLWQVFSKDRQALDNCTLENIIRLQSDKDFSPERYEHAIDLFLSTYQNGTVRKQMRRVDGMNYPKKRLKTEGLKRTPAYPQCWMN